MKDLFTMMSKLVLILFIVAVASLFGGCPVMSQSSCTSFEIKKVHAVEIGDVVYFNKYGQFTEVINKNTIRARKIKGQERINTGDYLHFFKTYDGYIIRLHAHRKIAVSTGNCNECRNICKDE